MEREDIKQIATNMVKNKGLINLSRKELCLRAKIPNGSFFHYMGCSFLEFVKELNDEFVEEPIHAVTKSRVSPELRRAHILKVAIGMSKTDGYHKITRDQIATKANVSVGLVSQYFGTMVKLRRVIIRHAIKNEILEIIAQAVLNKDPHVARASTGLKKHALKSIKV